MHRRAVERQKIQHPASEAIAVSLAAPVNPTTISSAGTLADFRNAPSAFTEQWNDTEYNSCGEGANTRNSDSIWQIRQRVLQHWPFEPKPAKSGSAIAGQSIDRENGGHIERMKRTDPQPPTRRNSPPRPFWGRTSEMPNMKSEKP